MQLEFVGNPFQSIVCLRPAKFLFLSFVVEVASHEHDSSKPATYQVKSLKIQCL